MANIIQYFKNPNKEWNSDLAIVFLRWGMAAVLLYSGISQIFAPTNWTGYLPQLLSQGSLGVPIILFNGAIEIFFGLMLAFGFYTRIAALLMALHLLGITVSIGFTATGVRDFGLTIALLSLVLLKADKYGVDYKLSKNKHQTKKHKVSNT